MCKANCFYCKNGDFIRGFADSMAGPGEPDSVECNRLDVPSNLYDKNDFNSDQEAYEYYAENCGHFDPTIIEKCSNCGKPMNVPTHEHDIWENEFYSGEAVPVCSKECKGEYKDKQDLEHDKEEEWRRIDWEASH